MADALVERGGRAAPSRFFCHSCNLEFSDTREDYICPYCSSGFVEEMQGAAAGGAGADPAVEDMDTDVSSLDDSDEQLEGHPIVNDLAFLMSGGRLRGMLGGAETLLQQFVWALAGGNDARTAGAGAPFVLVGAPGDYVLGGDGLDAVVTQLLGQLEGAGPPPLPRAQIDAIQSVPVTAEQATARLQCSVCWELFKQEEIVSKLSCAHVFHASCIEPWLQLHATCPICRRCLLPEEEPAEPPAADADAGASAARRLVAGRSTRRTPAAAGAPLRLPSGRLASSASSSSTASSVTSVGLSLADPSSSSSLDSGSSAAATDSAASRHSSQYNMDLDFD